MGYLEGLLRIECIHLELRTHLQGVVVLGRKREEKLLDAPPALDCTPRTRVGVLRIVLQGVGHLCCNQGVERLCCNQGVEHPCCNHGAEHLCYNHGACGTREEVVVTRRMTEGCSESGEVGIG